MSLHLPGAPDAEGRTLAVGLPGKSDGLAYVGMEIFTLAPGQSLARPAHGLEDAIVLFSGIGDLTAPGLAGPLGGRVDPFAGAGHTAYLPPGTAWRFTARSPCSLALCHAAVPPGLSAPPPRLITPAQVRQSTRGRDTYTRTIRDILPETEPALALLLVEVITPGGGWSSFPPHKHDEQTETETRLEEIYHHRFQDPRGFGFQRIYRQGGPDIAHPITHEATIGIAAGYHPVAAAPGYPLYYLNIMAGPRRLWRVSTDPAHGWLG